MNKNKFLRIYIISLLFLFYTSLIFANPDLYIDPLDIEFSSENIDLNQVVTISATIHNSGTDYINGIFTSNQSPGSCDGWVWDNRWVAQSFIPSEDINMTGVGLLVKEIKHDIFNIEIQSNSTSGYKPSGSDLTAVIISTHQLGAGPGYKWVDFIFDSYLSLKANTTYWIVAKSTYGGPHGNDAYYWNYESPGSYSSGIYAYYDSGSWTTMPDRDCVFKCYMTTITTVGFYDGDPDSAGIFISSDIVKPVQKGFARIASSTWTASPLGSHDIYVVVNGDKYIVETSTANNKAYSTILVGAPYITSAKTVDDDLNGKIDAYHIVFSTKVDDSTLVQTSTCGFEVTGYSNALFISTGLPNHPDIPDDNRIYISFDEGGSNDTFYKPQITYDEVTGKLKSVAGMLLQNIGTDALTETDGAAPVIINATAYDQSLGGEGIQSGDIVRFEFSESVYNPPDISSSIIDLVFLMTTGTWKDGNGNIGSNQWLASNYNLEIALSVNGGAPDIDVGYTITTDTYSFKDSEFNVSSHTVVLGGSFGTGGPDKSSPTIVSRWTQDLDSDGYIDAIYIVFNEDIVDSTVNVSSFHVIGADGENFHTGDTADDNIIYIKFNDGLLNTAETPSLDCALDAVKDTAGNSLVATNELCSDKAPPVVLSAQAKDNYNNVTGIDNDDTVEIRFSEPTDGPTIDAVNIENVFVLSGASTWLDGMSGIGQAVWNVTKDTLTITLSTDEGAPAISTGVVITVSSATITRINDSVNNICISSITLTGSFDKPDPPVVVIASTVDDDKDGQIDGYHIIFSHAMKDSTLVQTSTCGFKVTGRTVGVFISTGLPNHADVADDEDIYISFNESSSLDTDETPQLIYFSTSGLFADGYNQQLNDISEAGLTESDGAAPILISASASDISGGGAGIQTGDEVQLTFNEAVEGDPIISAENIDNVLISAGTFKDGNEFIGSAKWDGGIVLTITLSANNGEPTIAPGFTITTDTDTFYDTAGNVSSSTVVLGGNFGVDTSSPIIISRWTQDLDSDGYIDAIYIVFSDDIVDSTVNVSSFNVIEADGEHFYTGDTPDDNIIYIKFNDGLLTTAETPSLDCALDAVKNTAGNSLLATNELCSDKAPPIVLSARAKDNYNNITGIDNDDTVEIRFSEPTNGPTIDAFNIESVFLLSGGMTWLDGTSGIGSSVWNVTRDTLTITLSTDGGAPTISTGVVITVSSATITKINDSVNNICISSITLTGSFDKPDPPVVVNASTVDDDKDGQIDGYHIIFSHAMKDSTLVQTSTCGFKVTGRTVGVFISTGLPNHADVADDEDIYISFNESGSLDTDETPQLIYFSTSGLFADGYNQQLGDISEGGLTESDGAAPILNSATASDTSGGGAGIQTGDKVRLTFSEAISGPPNISASNVDDVLITSGTFKNNDGFLGPDNWSGMNSILEITLVSGATQPDISPGFTITTDIDTFYDTAGNVSSSTVVLEGNFGVDISISSPIIISRWTQDLDSNGYIDAVYIIFDKNIDDSTVKPGSFTVSGLQGQSFITGEVANDKKVYILFDDGQLTTGETPTLAWTDGAVKSQNGNSLLFFTSENCTDKAPPAIINAVASDGDILKSGVDSDDSITISFSEAIPEGPTIDASNIDSVLLLSGTTSWENAAGNWNEGRTVLTIYIGSNISTNAISVGDVITVSSGTLQIDDSAGNVCIDSAIITGTFEGFDETRPVIISRSPDREETVVPVNSLIKIHFSERMDVDNTKNAIKVREIKNNFSQSLNSFVSGDVSCNVDSSQFVFTPSVALKNNYTYQVEVSTSVRDTIGNYMNEKYIFEFTTIANCREENIYTCETGNTKIEIMPYTISEDFSVNMSTSPSSFSNSSMERIIRANNKVDNDKRRFTKFFNYTLREFTVYDKNDKMKDSFNKDIKIQIPYKDEDEDGFMDDTFPLISEKSLSIYRLDEGNNLWVKIPSEVDRAENLVRAGVTHFSVFILLGSEYTDLSEAYAFPVPFKPSDGHSKITFTNLSSKAEINIYTVSGGLVKTLNEVDGDFILDWNPVRNEQGKEVASGVYIYRIHNEKENKCGKLIIIR